jgi:hypothetical protein
MEKTALIISTGTGVYESIAARISQNTAYNQPTRAHWANLRIKQWPRGTYNTAWQNSVQQGCDNSGPYYHENQGGLRIN